MFIKFLDLHEKNSYPAFVPRYLGTYYTKAKVGTYLGRCRVKSVANIIC